jgi:hypothetical protein
MMVTSLRFDHGSTLEMYNFDNFQIVYHEYDLKVRLNVRFLKVDILTDFNK